MHSKKTTINRREFVGLSTSAFAGALLAPVNLAGAEPQREISARHGTAPMGFYRFSLGDSDFTVISDGFFHLSEITPPDMKPIEGLSLNADKENRQKYFGERLSYSDDPRLNLSPVIIETGGRRILVDGGWPLQAASANTGRLDPCLEMLDIAPESIDIVIVTHAHPDHIGLANPDTGALFYPNAEVVITDVELAFWKSDDAAPILDHPLFEWIPNVLNALDGQLRTIKADDEIITGIRSIPSHGHTPGHISLGVEAGGRELLLTGDALVNIHTTFERPDWHNFFDMEREQASRTRRNLLDRAATDEMLILGYHFPFPGLGYAEQYGDAYKWHAAGATLLG